MSKPFPYIQQRRSGLGHSPWLPARTFLSRPTNLPTKFRIQNLTPFSKAPLEKSVLSSEVCQQPCFGLFSEVLPPGDFKTLAWDVIPLGYWLLAVHQCWAGLQENGCRVLVLRISVLSSHRIYSQFFLQMWIPVNSALCSRELGAVVDLPCSFPLTSGPGHHLLRGVTEKLEAL